MLEKVSAPFASVWSHLKELLKEVGVMRDPSNVTLEDFRLELADLGLLGRPFGPEEYAAALEEYLGIEIGIEEIPDAGGGPMACELAGQMAVEGILAEVVVDEETGDAVIFARESLRYQPWPAYELSIFHELSHLAAGHPLRVKRARERGVRNKFRALGSRLARREPSPPASGEELEKLKQKVFEPEARKRAKWLVLAGTCPRAFEAEKANRLT